MKAAVAVPITAALVVRAWSRKSLTPAGIIAAVATAVIHAIHPWSVFFACLVVFFLGGTAVTKVSAAELSPHPKPLLSPEGKKLVGLTACASRLDTT